MQSKRTAIVLAGAMALGTGGQAMGASPVAGARAGPTGGLRAFGGPDLRAVAANLGVTAERLRDALGVLHDEGPRREERAPVIARELGATPRPRW